MLHPAALLILALVLVMAPPAAAQCPAGTPGAVIGPGCLACWTPPTTNTDGSPLVQPVTYRLYVYPPSTPPVIGTTPATLHTSDHLNVKACGGLSTPGQQLRITVTAVDGQMPPRESAPAPAWPFIFDRPGQIVGAGIR